MDITQLRTALQACNLSKLSRDSGVHIRTLRRIKHEKTEDILVGTIEKIKPHLRAARSNK
jgi:DNA-binding Xre family transcriptional regulator